jgi:hypothetical protein
VLHESLAINLYLAKKHGGSIAPANLAEDALMTMWALWAAAEVESHALTVLNHRVGARIVRGRAEGYRHGSLLVTPARRSRRGGPSGQQSQLGKHCIEFERAAVGSYADDIASVADLDYVAFERW